MGGFWKMLSFIWGDWELYRKFYMFAEAKTQNNVFRWKQGVIVINSDGQNKKINNLVR